MSTYIGGCVEKDGEYDLPINCTLRKALDIAGGIKTNGRYTPTGVITIKMKLPEKPAKQKKSVNFKEDLSILDKEIIKDNEIVIVQINGDKFLDYEEK